MAEISDFLKREVRVERVRFNIAPRLLRVQKFLMTDKASRLASAFGLNLSRLDELAEDKVDHADSLKRGFLFQKLGRLPHERDTAFIIPQPRPPGRDAAMPGTVGAGGEEGKNVIPHGSAE